MYKGHIFHKNYAFSLSNLNSIWLDELLEPLEPRFLELSRAELFQILNSRAEPSRAKWFI